MSKILNIFHLTCILFGTAVLTYDQDYICPWSRDGKTRLVFDGNKCVVPNTSEEFNCPATDGHYKCPESDRKYYSCRNGVSSLESCPSDTIFDGTDACISQSFRCPKPVGKFRYPRNAHNYYQCWYNRPHVRSCQKHQQFTGRDCEEVQTRRPVAVRHQRRQQFTCPEDNGVYPDRRDRCCFWVCQDRTPTKGRCPQNACGCASRWRTVSGLIVHQDNGHQIVDTWNTQTHEWDRSYRNVPHIEQNTGQLTDETDKDPRLVIEHQNDDRVPGYPVLAENSEIEDQVIGQDDYQADY